MAKSAPRYPLRLLRLIETLDDEDLTLAEVARLVGAAAEREGITRPSPVHVRALVADLRRHRAEQREIRQAALGALGLLAAGGSRDPLGAQWAAMRARERIDARGRRS